MSSLLSLVSGAARADGRTVGRTVPLHLLPLLPLAISLNRQGWGGQVSRFPGRRRKAHKYPYYLSTAAAECPKTIC